MTELLILYATSLDTIVTSEALFLLEYLISDTTKVNGQHNAVVILLNHPPKKETDPLLQTNAGS